MWVIKINNRLCRDDRGHIYKYSSRSVAESKALLMVKNSLQKEYKLVAL
ncbi:MAG: hypothetical protein IJN06_07060 [Bacteroidales bacterium]|nr:hypothetical protein [Bacteroidales bacterium]